MSYEPRAAFAGQIAELPVVELLQTILQGAHTGVARFETPVGAATIWFRDGALVDADMGRHHMEAAVVRLLALDSGTFEVEFKPISRRQVITATTADLIANARAGVPSAVPADEHDASRKRARRAGLAWHPTGGGRPRADASGPVPIVRPPGAPTGPVPTVRPADGAAADASGPVSIVATTTATAAARAPATVPAPAGPPTTMPAPSGSAATLPAGSSATMPAGSSATIPAPVSDGPPRPTPGSADAPSGPRRTMFGMPTAVATNEEDRTLLRAAVTPPRAPTPPPVGATTTAGPAAAAPTAPASTGPTIVRPDVAPAAAPTAVVADGSARLVAAPATPLLLEPRPAEWGTGTMPAVSENTDGAPTLNRRAGSAEAGGTVVARAPVGDAPSTTVVPDAPDPIDRTLMAPAWRPAPPVAPPPAQTPAQTPVQTPAQTPAQAGPATAIPPFVVTPSGATVVPTPPGAPPPPQPSPSDAHEPSSQTMTAGSLRRATPAIPARPGRRTEDRLAAVAGAIGLGPPERRVSEAARLDQQVEAAASAGLAGAAAPAVVGRYEVLLRIARGGMGTVYLARVTGEGGFRRLFALKVVRDHLSQNDEYVRMLLQEARIASRLHHPNVVGIVDIGTLANQHYLVMDYVEGCTFSELLKVHRRTRPPHLIVPIVLDALMGLHAAHSLVDDDGSPLTLVHCDFSPQNMLLGTNGVCRITDFGIAKATNVIVDRPSITRGKPAYVSPEQVVGRPLDHRSDIFSAGVVLWNALTGEQLFGGDTPEATLQAVLTKPIVPPSTVGLRPPTCFDRVCMRALERDPDRRYQTAEEMLIDLRRIAIAEDFLAPASDVGRWVSETFGRQLELRRQAAGIAKPTSGAEAAAVVRVPELGFGDAELTSETRALPPDYAATPPPSDSSRTAMLRPSAVEAAAAAQDEEPGTPPMTKAIVIVVAAALATITLLIAYLRPEWIQRAIGDGAPQPAADEGATTGEEEGGKTEEPETKRRKRDVKADAKGERAPSAPTTADAKADATPPEPTPEPVVPKPEPVTPEKPTPPATPTTPATDAAPEKPTPAAKPKPKKPKKPKPSPTSPDAPEPIDPDAILDGPPG